MSNCVCQSIVGIYSTVQYSTCNLRNQIPTIYLRTYTSFLKRHFSENNLFFCFYRSSPNAKKELFSMDKINSNVVLEDNLQCKFNPRNFKILYVINSENCFYRKLALTRAKNVSFNNNRKTS